MVFSTALHPRHRSIWWSLLMTQLLLPSVRAKWWWWSSPALPGEVAAAVTTLMTAAHQSRLWRSAAIWVPSSQKLLGFLRLCHQSFRWTRKYYLYFRHVRLNLSGTVVKQIRKLSAFSLCICKVFDGTELGKLQAQCVRLKSLSIKKRLTFQLIWVQQTLQATTVAFIQWLCSFSALKKKKNRTLIRSVDLWEGADSKRIYVGTRSNWSCQDELTKKKLVCTISFFLCASSGWTSILAAERVGVVDRRRWKALLEEVARQLVAKPSSVTMEVIRLSGASTRQTRLPVNWLKETANLQASTTHTEAFP